MYKLIKPTFNFYNKSIISNSVKRYFLSKAYKCDEEWKNRLKNPIFTKVDLGNLYYELDVNFQKNRRISMLDVDVLFNSIVDSNYKNELDDVLLKLRLCPESRILPERATHAVIRWYMDNVTSDELFNTLSDRLNYGLFPNYHLTNLLMDKYLKEKDSKSAVKVAVLQMLQEDFDNSIMKALALYCCYNYLESSDIWETYKEPPPDPDEEVQKVRVKYLRNPYFDDHFDIKDTNHLVGKTLYLFGCTVDNIIGVSSQLVGLILYEKYEKCSQFLESCIEKNIKFHKEAVIKGKEYALNKPKQSVDDNEVEKKDKNGNGDKVDEWKNKVLELLENIKKDNLVNGSILSESAEFVRKVVKENESNDIKEQCKVYKQWEKDREDLIESEIKRAELERIVSEMENTKAELKQEEEKLFFFDEEEELNIIAKQKEEQMSKVVYFIEKKKKKETTGDEYIPPKVQQKTF